MLVVNASSVAADIGVPPAVIGFTLVALGTSMPELVTAIQAQRRGESDLLVGNLLGSNLFNSLGGGAAIGLAAPDGHTESFSPWLLVSALAWFLLHRSHRVTRPEAVLLLIAYGLTLPMPLLRTRLGK